MHTPDLTQANIDKIAQLFPHVVTEAEDEDGNLTKKIDFDLLRQSLSKDIVEDTTERYRLDRPGKKRALLKANTPITKTLRPVVEDSVNRDTTENLYLEGDNFEILKILQESYLGKVKMIYIDPPYNTGKDFVYKDDFKISKSDYESELGAVDEEWGKLFKNTDTNGRYHSDWLSMMYSRLTVARDLLTDDGVIFMSIDDNEVHNLRKIADEVFGEENFIIQFVWKTRQASWKQVAENNTSSEHEYILSYQKTNNVKFLWLERDLDSYKNPDNDPRWPWAKHPLDVGSTKDERPNCYYELIDPKTWNKYMANPNRVWAFAPMSMNKLLEEWKIIFHPEWKTRPYLKKFFNELKSEFKPISTWLNQDDFDIWYNTEWTKIVNNTFDWQKIFDYPKPISIIKLLISQIANWNEIILDFFSWSATTAHAVLQLNAEDGWNRKWIMAQLPEETDPESEAYKAGYKYITEIGKERIRRAGKKILEDNKDTLAKRETPLDIWFRVYKTDTSNMKDVYYHPSQIKQSDLWLFTSNIKDDRTPNDLLTQVMLDRGLTLDLPMRETKIGNNTVFYVADNALVACFDEKIDIAIIDQIAVCQPLKVVFRDASFKDVADRINVETRMKRLSPDTQISVI